MTRQPLPPSPTAPAKATAKVPAKVPANAASHAPALADRRGILTAILEGLCDGLGLAAAVVTQLDSDQQRGLASFGLPLPPILARDVLCERVLASPGPIALSCPEASPFAPHQTCLGVRMDVDGRAVGALYALSEDSRELDDQCSHWLDRTAQLVAATLHDYPGAHNESDKVQRFFEMSREAMAVIDQRGHITTANGAWCQLLELAEADVMDTPVVQLIHTDELRRVLEESADLVIRGIPTTVELRLGPPVSSSRWFSATIASDPVNSSYYAMLRDITTTRAIEQLKSEFVSTVSHELRTPLTSIRGALGLVASGSLGPLPPAVDELIDIANRNAARLIRLVNDILDVERMASGRMVYDMAVLNLVDVVTDAIEAMQTYGLELNVRVRLTASPPRAIVRGDAERLRQVLDNLLANAVRFSPPRGEVAVRILQDGGLVRVEIQDQGPGIPVEFQPSIFGRFAQAPGPDGRGGSGLGLNISRNIITAHRGHLAFDTTPGSGTTFWFQLAQHTDIAPADGRSGPCILICEDDRDVAQAVELMIEHIGYRTIMAPTATHARQILSDPDAANNIDAIILDLGLPDEDGLDMLRDLRSQGLAPVPVIILSGSTQVRTHDLAQVTWLHKPISAALLVSGVTQLFKPTCATVPTLLHVEHDAELRSIVTALMRPHATTVGVDSLRSALDALSSQSFDGVVLDLDLPDGDGSDLLDRLAMSRRDLPVVLFTAIQPTPETMRRAYQSLVKSRDSEEQLVDVLCQMLAERSTK